MKKLNPDELTKVKSRLESVATLLDQVGSVSTGTSHEDRVTQIRCLIEDLREDLEEE